MNAENSKNYYDILGVSRNADFQTIKRAYYRRAKECHPDRFGGEKKKEEEFKRLVEAFNVLSDPVTRRHYNKGEYQERKEAAWKGQSIHFGYDEEAIMDSFADDTLEEMIVGNTIPHNTTLRTLMKDLESTRKFCTFREAKNLFYKGHITEAKDKFLETVEWSPHNILYRFYYGKSCYLLSKWREAEKQYRIALQLGLSRQPPQRLQRIRNELEKIHEKHRGLLSRMLRRRIPEPLSMLTPEEKMRNRVSREMTKLEHRSAHPHRRLKG